MQCVSPVEIWPHRSIEWRDLGNVEKPVLVPCGKCLPCLSNKRQDWIFRLNQEHKVSKSALFVTLTYSQKFCPESVSKRHLQLFMKRLRKKEKSRIRYFAVGEYGTKRRRPHYHLLLFNCELSGETIRKSWMTKNGQPFGIVHIGQVTASSIAYCTKYVVQPEQKIPDKTPPFTLMSRGYGIGLNYLTDAMVSWHRADDRNYTLIHNKKGRLPRYYKSKIWYNEEDKTRVGNKSKWDAIKSQRKVLKQFVEKYGVDDAKNKMREFRNAQLSRIKVKVSFTEKL